MVNVGTVLVLVGVGLGVLALVFLAVVAYGVLTRVKALRRAQAGAVDRAKPKVDAINEQLALAQTRVATLQLDAVALPARAAEVQGRVTELQQARTAGRRR